MLRRPNPYANVSLAAPETMQANFAVPEMNLPAVNIPQDNGPDTGDQVAGLGASILGLKKRFGNQGGAIKDALASNAGGKYGF